jgi:adenosylhomocysteine nucleosidase
MSTASHPGPDTPAVTGVVAAMEEEIADLRSRLDGARAMPLAGAHVTLGWIGAGRVVLAVTGDGERNARRGLSALLASQRVTRLVVAGVAGGLSPDLDAGALVIASRVINQADGDVRTADPALVDIAARASGARRGVAVTATRIADTAEEKRRLLAMALAIPDSTAKPVAVVDLESAIFAAVASGAGVPWTVLRAVSDTAADSIPSLLNRSRDDGGAVRRGRVAWGLLTAPGALLPLLALRERVRTCAGHLAQAIERTVVALHAADDLYPPAAGTERKEKALDGT